MKIERLRDEARLMTWNDLKTGDHFVFENSNRLFRKLDEGRTLDVETGVLQVGSNGDHKVRRVYGKFVETEREA